MATITLTKSNNEKPNLIYTKEYKTVAYVTGLNHETGYGSLEFQNPFGRFFVEITDDFENKATKFEKGQLYQVTIKIRSFVSPKTELYGTKIYITKIEDAPHDEDYSNNQFEDIVLAHSTFGKGLEKMFVCSTLVDGNTLGDPLRLRYLRPQETASELNQPIEKEKYYKIKFKLANMKTGMRTNGEVYNYPTSETKSIVDGVEIIKIKDGFKPNLILISYEKVDIDVNQ